METLPTADAPQSALLVSGGGADAFALGLAATTHAVWTDASQWRGGHTWAWVDHAGSFAHGRGMGFAIDNNEAELWAIAEALRTIPIGHVVHVNTDSVAAAALMSPFADVDRLPANPKRDAATLYRECLEEIGLVSSGKSVVVHWLKGHRSSGRNVAADRLATAARWVDTTPDEWILDYEHALAAIGGSPQSRCSCGHRMGAEDASRTTWPGRRAALAGTQERLAVGYEGLQSERHHDHETASCSDSLDTAERDTQVAKRGVPTRTGATAIERSVYRQ